MSKIPKPASPETGSLSKSSCSLESEQGLLCPWEQQYLEIPSKGAGCITFKNKRRRVEALCRGRCMCSVIQPHSSSGARECICLLSWTKMNSKTNRPLCKGRHNPKKKREKKKKLELVVWVKYVCLKRPFTSGDKHCLPFHTAVAFTWLAGK